MRNVCKEYLRVDPCTIWLLNLYLAHFWQWCCLESLWRILYDKLDTFCNAFYWIVSFMMLSNLWCNPYKRRGRMSRVVQIFCLSQGQTQSRFDILRLILFKSPKFQLLHFFRIVKQFLKSFETKRFSFAWENLWYHSGFEKTNLESGSQDRLESSYQQNYDCFHKRLLEYQDNFEFVAIKVRKIATILVLKVHGVWMVVSRQSFSEFK